MAFVKTSSVPKVSGQTAPLEAARFKGKYPVVYAGCFAAALGLKEKAKVVTGDPEFKKFGETVAVEWIP